MLQCSQLCGDGVQKRQIRCYRKESSKIVPLADEECIDPKPESEKKCMLRPCEGVDWIVSSWSNVSALVDDFLFIILTDRFFILKCKPCGLTQEARTIICAAKDGKVFNDTFCANHELPLTRRTCESSTICQFQWFKSQWSKCSAECGNGIQTRHVFCGSFDGSVVTKDEDETKCGDTAKPLDTQECKGAEAECQGKWFSGPWTKCSKTCGGGQRTRKVLCLVDGVTVKNSQCSEDTIEFDSEECNKEECSEDMTLPVDVTSKPIVEDDDVGEEWCPEGEEDYNEPLFKEDGLDWSIGDDIDNDESPLVTSDFDDEFMMSDGTEPSVDGLSSNIPRKIAVHFVGYTPPNTYQTYILK